MFQIRSVERARNAATEYLEVSVASSSDADLRFLEVLVEEAT